MNAREQDLRFEILEPMDVRYRLLTRTVLNLRTYASARNLLLFAGVLQGALNFHLNC